MLSVLVTRLRYGRRMITARQGLIDALALCEAKISSSIVDFGELYVHLAQQARFAIAAMYDPDSGARRVWVIEQEGKPVSCGTGPLPHWHVDGAVTWYGPTASAEGLDALRALAALLKATGDAARATAYAGTVPASQRAIFAGRSDGFGVAADWLTALVTEIATGALGPFTAGPVPPAGTPPAEPP